MPIRDWKSALNQLVSCLETGCLTGTFGGALAVRGVELGERGLTADVRGEIEREEDNVLVIKRTMFSITSQLPMSIRIKFFGHMMFMHRNVRCIVHLLQRLKSLQSLIGKIGDNCYEKIQAIGNIS
jgi:hypothetical protein